MGLGALRAELLLTPAVDEDALTAVTDRITEAVAAAVRRGIADGLAALDQMVGEPDPPPAPAPAGPGPGDLTTDQLRTVGGAR